MAKAHSKAIPVGAIPGKAPPCIRKTAEAAVIFPFFFMPILTSIEAEAVGPVARKTSDLVITNFTGRPPAFRERASESASEKIVVLPPKPPPISDGVTLS